MSRDKGECVGWIVVGYSGAPLAFNGENSYFETYSARQRAEVFASREDAEWVAYQEREIAKRIAADHRGEEREKWLRHAKRVGVMELVSFGFDSSPHVAALQEAEREMRRTGYFPAKTKIKEWISAESRENAPVDKFLKENRR